MTDYQKIPQMKKGLAYLMWDISYVYTLKDRDQPCLMAVELLEEGIKRREEQTNLSVTHIILPKEFYMILQEEYELKFKGIPIDVYDSRIKTTAYIG